MRISRVAAFGLSVGWAGPALAAAYSMADVGRFGGTITTAAAINASGVVAGNSLDANGVNHGFVYSNGQLIDIGTYQGLTPKVRAINSAGVVEGNLSNGDLFVWSNGSFTDIGLPSNFTSARGNGFNDSGEIAGQANLTNGEIQAFYYNPAGGGTFATIGTLGGMPSATQFSYGSSINSSGQIEGDSINANGQDHAFIWTPNGSTGSWNDLGTLGGSASSGVAVNNLGHATGTGGLANGNFDPFFYNGTTMLDCGNLGGAYGNAGGINNEDQIVGYDELADNVTDHAFLYSNGVMVDLNTLIPANSGWTLTGASGINDSGDIVATGVNAAGQQDAFLLIPVPEPSALAVPAVAVLAARPLRRRRA